MLSDSPSSVNSSTILSTRTTTTPSLKSPPPPSSSLPVSSSSSSYHHYSTTTTNTIHADQDQDNDKSDLTCYLDYYPEELSSPLQLLSPTTPNTTSTNTTTNNTFPFPTMQDSFTKCSITADMDTNTDISNKDAGCRQHTNTDTIKEAGYRQQQQQQHDQNKIIQWYCCQCGNPHGDITKFFSENTGPGVTAAAPASYYYLRNDCLRCTHLMCPYCTKGRFHNYASLHAGQGLGQGQGFGAGFSSGPGQGQSQDLFQNHLTTNSSSSSH